jgi:hypothetical protein
VCGEERQDARISVYTRTKRIGEIPFQENVRYCNDRIDCIKGAKGIHHTKIGKE